MYILGLLSYPLSPVRMPMCNHSILMPHVMIKNNGDFHFPSPSFPYLLFLSSHRKATCLLLYEFSLDFLLSPGDWEDVGWVMMVILIPFWHFCLDSQCQLQNMASNVADEDGDRTERRRVTLMGCTHWELLSWTFAPLVFMATKGK